MADEIIQQCANQVMDLVQLVMRNVGPEVRKRTNELSLPQFRTLQTIKHKDNASLSEVAEHLGSNISAASKTVDGLVDRGLLARETAVDDRRKLVLTLTEKGKATLELMDVEMLKCLAEKLSSLSSGECAMVNLTTNLLRQALIRSKKSED